MERDGSERGAGPPESVGDANLRRLLEQAYRPEELPADLAERVEKAMCAAASEEAARRRQDGSRPAQPAARAIRIGRRLGLALAAGVVIAFGVGLYLGGYFSPPSYERSGGLVWINGKPFVAADRVARVDGAAEPATRGATQRHVGGVMTPRPRGEAPEAVRVKVGEAVRTERGQRRRVVLADGSVLYANEGTRVAIRGRRHVEIAAGEVFLEVEPGADAAFVVDAPHRQVTALGTKFGVKVLDGDDRVLVTQGRVRVSGVGAAVRAGQQYEPANKGKPVCAAPRASHVLQWTRDLIAAAESPLVPDSKFAGGALICVDPWGQETRLTLRKVHVDVHVEDGFARTTIDQTYFNHENWRQEGTFYFPLPPEASLSRLAMYVEGRLMEGGMAEREHARQVYESIVYRQKDPALLEWVDGSTFKMRVFPLEPRREKRIIISYTQKLPGLYGRKTYRFAGGHSLGLVGHWSMHVRVKNARDMEFETNCQYLAATRKDGDLLLEAERKQVKPEQDVVIHLDDTAAADGEAGDLVRFSSAAHESGRYLMLRWTPDLGGAAVPERRDWVFLFESSAARDPVVARVQADVVRTILANAEHSDTFSIVTAGTRTHRLADEPLPASPANIRRAMGFLDGSHLVGALDLDAALTEAAQALHGLPNPHLVHLGSAIATLGERRCDLLVRRLPLGATYVGVAVGKSWSRQFMKAAAARTGGYFTQINPDEEVTWRAFELLATLNTPRLLNVKVADDAGKAPFLSYTDSVAGGEELAAVARFGLDEEPPRSVTVSGDLAGEPYARKVAVDGIVQKADYLPRIWAKMEIDRLLADDAAKNKQRVIELSKSMYVMSPYTSLLVLENEAMYKQFNVDRGRKDHWALYPAPERIQVVYEPDPNWPHGRAGRGAAADEQARQKPTRQEVMGTIMVRLPAQVLRWPNRSYYSGGQAVTAWQAATGAYGAGYHRGWGRWGGWNRDHDPEGREGMARWAERTGLGDARKDLDEKDQASGPAPAALPPGIARGYEFTERDRLATASPMVSRLSSLRGNLPDDFYPGRDAGRGMHELDRVEDLGKRGGYKEDGRLREHGWGLSLAPRASIPSPGQPFAEPGPAGEWGEGVANEKRLEKGDKGAQWGARSLSRRLTYGNSYYYQALTYQRAYYSGDQRAFSDLLAYAPGLNTTWADVEAAVEAEGRPDPRTAPGVIDPEARKLIDAARGAGWERVALPARAGRPAATIILDGAGRYRCERLLECGLKEIVDCDGETLLHAYPEIGLAARRTVSRFHRAELMSLVPWHLPPAEDLARGADVRRIGERTVAVTARGAGSATDEDGKVRPYVRVELDFGRNGRLTERRIVRMPERKLLDRYTYGADGTVRQHDGEGKVRRAFDLSAKRAEAPKELPGLDGLVVLPMPYRTVEPATRAVTIAVPADFGRVTDEQAMRMAAAYVGGYRNWDLVRLIGHRYFAKGDRRIGFYVLLEAVNYSPPANAEVDVGDSVRVRLDPVKDHPASHLARFCAYEQDVRRQGHNAKLPEIPESAGGFIGRLAEAHDLINAWQSGRATHRAEDRRTQSRRMVAFLDGGHGDTIDWAVLAVLMNYGGDSTLNQAIAEACSRFRDTPGLAYLARYEHARHLGRAGKWDEARKAFGDLYAETIARGVLPPVDHDFRNAFQQGGAPTNWATFTRETAAKLMKDGLRVGMVYLAWQCHQLGDQPLAEEVFGCATTGVDAAGRASTYLAGVEYLYHTGQQARAEAMLDVLLADEKLSGMSELWQLAATIAGAQGKLARALACQERAIDLAYADLPDVVNLQLVRREFGSLLGRYQQLANAIATLERDPPAELVAKVIRAADRWRSLDSDDTPACQAAARALGVMGLSDLAWDYLTTPLAERSNEAGPWVSLAGELRRQGRFELAVRAYTTAFEVEPTNAQVLWDKAQLLQQSGRHVEAQKMYRRIATTDWQPRFNWIKQMAKQYAGT